MKNTLTFFLLFFIFNIGFSQPVSRFDEFIEFVQQGDYEQVKKLINNSKININEYNSEGSFALWEAVNANQEDIVLLLIESGANIHQKRLADWDIDNLPFYKLAYRTDFAEEYEEQKANNTLKDRVFFSVSSAFWTACRTGNLEIVKMFIENGYDINFQEEIGQFTPLHIAATNGQLEIVEYLIENEANLEATTFTGASPLILAAKNYHYEILSFLLEMGSDITLKDQHGKTALDYAVKNGDKESCEVLKGWSE